MEQDYSFADRQKMQWGIPLNMKLIPTLVRIVCMGWRERGMKK